MVVLALVVVLAGPVAWAGGPAERLRVTWVAVLCGAGALTAVRSRVESSPVLAVAAVLVAALGLTADALVDVHVHSARGRAIATTAMGVVALAAARTAVTRLSGCLRGWAHDQADLQVELLQRDRALRELREREEEKLHEVRNLLAGVHGAHDVLGHGDIVLDEATRCGLQATVQDELQRLAHLLDPCAADPVADLDLDQVLASVVMAARLRGQDVAVRLRGCRASARSGDVATAVANLLTNAERHAPGARVVVDAVTAAGRTVLRVTDDGPGIAPQDRQRVVRRGVRSSTAGAGSGLGLYTVDRIVAQLGGSMSVDEAPGGGTRVSLVLQAARGAVFIPAQPSGDRALAPLTPVAHSPR